MESKDSPNHPFRKSKEVSPGVIYALSQKSTKFRLKMIAIVKIKKAQTMGQLIYDI